MTEHPPDLVVAFALADLADRETMRWWSPNGVTSTTKADGSPVTAADVAAEEAVRQGVMDAHPSDGFLGEEVGATSGATARRWIVDGIDGTKYFAAGDQTWGTLIALEVEGEIRLGVVSSPAQDRRWWAVRGGGAFTGRCVSSSADTSLQVSARRVGGPRRVSTLPFGAGLEPSAQRLIDDLSGRRPADPGWCQQMRVAEGQLDMCIWFCGGIWDHAAPSIIVEEAGGRFSDHTGGARLDTRTAIYSNGLEHDEVVAALIDAARN